MKTNIGLVAHCEKALKERWYYLWGEFGRIPTKQLIENNIKKYPANARWRTYAQQAIGKSRVCDCYGLVKSYLWWTGDTLNPKYNINQDTNTSGAFNRAKEKGKLNTLPEIPGIILYMSGHVGVYIGRGRFIELMGNGVGAFEGKIQNGKIIKGSKFTHWFKDVNINYEQEVKFEEEIEMRYNKLEEVPSYARETIKKLIDKGLLQGDGNNLNLSEDMIRIFVINDRAGAYDK